MKGKELLYAVSAFLKSATNFGDKEILTFSSLITAYSITEDRIKADVLKVFILAVEAITKIVSGISLDVAMKVFNTTPKLN